MFACCSEISISVIVKDVQHIFLGELSMFSNVQGTEKIASLWFARGIFERLLLHIHLAFTQLHQNWGKITRTSRSGRSSRLELLYQKLIWNILQSLLKKKLCWSLFLMRLQAYSLQKSASFPENFAKCSM